MPFLETPRFPEQISYGSTFTTRKSTSVVMSQSGYESRNRLWSQSRKVFDVGYGVRRLEQLYEVIEYFEVVGGRADGFRFKDWSDYKSVSPLGTPTNLDLIFGTGDGIETDFQLIKTYSKGALSYSRTIRKPVSGTILIAVDGTPVFEPAQWTLDYATGIVTFVSPPANTAVLTWGGEFDVPVRFDSDDLDVTIDGFEAGNLTIPVVEIRTS